MYGKVEQSSAIRLVRVELVIKTHSVLVRQLMKPRIGLYRSSNI